MRATLSTALRQEDFAVAIPLAERFTDGIADVIAAHDLPWHVQRLGCRAEYWFCPPPRTARRRRPPSTRSSTAFLHLWTLNRGVLLAPFHNMSLFCPAHTGRTSTRTPRCSAPPSRRCSADGSPD